MGTNDLSAGSEQRPRVPAIGLTLGLSGLLIAACAAGTMAQDKGQEKKAEGKAIQFLTPHDSVIASRLREKGTVELAVVRPYKADNKPCRLSDFKRVEGISPQEGEYFIEQVLLSRKPRTKAAAAGYFPKPMYRGATLRNIAAKGTLGAIFHMYAMPLDGKRLRFVVCESTVSAHSEEADHNLRDD